MSLYVVLYFDYLLVSHLIVFLRYTYLFDFDQIHTRSPYILKAHQKKVNVFIALSNWCNYRITVSLMRRTCISHENSLAASAGDRQDAELGEHSVENRIDGRGMKFLGCQSNESLDKVVPILHRIVKSQGTA